MSKSRIIITTFSTISHWLHVGTSGGSKYKKKLMLCWLNLLVLAQLSGVCKHVEWRYVLWVKEDRLCMRRIVSSVSSRGKETYHNSVCPSWSSRR